MGFECCHPAVNLVYFAAVIGGTVCFRHPMYLAISLICAFLYSVKRNGRRGVVLGFCMALLVVGTGLLYSSYHHFGVTNLRQNFIGNQITLESLVYGLILGGVLAGVVLWMSCVYAVFSTDKVVYLLGRASPRLALFLSQLLRLIPEVGAQARKLHVAQQGIGRGLRQGYVLRRWKNGLRMFSMLVTWTVETLAAASDSMRSRGSGRKGRTAFSTYRFDNRDRAFVVGLFACLTVVWMGAALGQTGMRCNPRIIWNPVTPLSWIFWGVYTLLCLLPGGLEVWTEYRFRRARTRCCQSPGFAHDVWRRFHETDHSERSAGGCASRGGDFCLPALGNRQKLP